MTLFDDFDQRWQIPPPPAANAPIFLLSAGWRSGSTLLQRLIMSSGEVLMWGEPYGRAGVIPSMTRSALCLRQNWPNENHFPNVKDLDLSNSWVANLYPEARALRDAFRAQLDTLLAKPAQAQGYSRWGLKEVRLRGEDAQMLSWLYPDARFVLLVRNPWDAWSSAKGVGFALHWPTQMINDVDSFTKHWVGCVRSFAALDPRRFVLIRYEDLISAQVGLPQLARHLQLSHMDPAVLQRKIRGVRTPRSPLSEQECQRIQTLIGDCAPALRYEPPARQAPPSTST